MTTRMNAAMRQMLERKPEALTMPPDMDALVLRGWTRDNGLYLWGDTVVHGLSAPATPFEAVGYEAACNHVHLERGESGSPLEPSDLPRAVATGIALARRLTNQLRTDEVSRIMFIVSAQLDGSSGVVVRSHTVRDEGGRWLADDLEGYEEEAVLEATGDELAALMTNG